jgi:hypothetical protein
MVIILRRFAPKRFDRWNAGSIPHRVLSPCPDLQPASRIDVFWRGLMKNVNIRDTSPRQSGQKPVFGAKTIWHADCLCSRK